MRKQESIVYVNFDPYDNSGKVLDYLIEHFSLVVHFSYDHLRLKHGRKNNLLSIYKKKVLIKRKRLLHLRTIPILLYPSLPLVAMLIIVQTIIYARLLSKKYGRFDTYFTVNAFTAWIGILIRNMGLCKKTVFWVWDYFPIKYPVLSISLARLVYWQFDRFSLASSNRVAFTNIKLYRRMKRAGFIKGYRKPMIVPIATEIKNAKPIKKPAYILGFLGMLKWPQGLDMIFDNFEKLSKAIPNIKLEIIGSGPEEDRFKMRAKQWKNQVRFYGFIEHERRMERIIRRWSIGLAPYVPSVSNESYWGDPSKIKMYLSLGIPVITTDVSYMSDVIKKARAGIIVDYDKGEEFIHAVKAILKKRSLFQKNAHNLAKTYNYRKFYPRLLKD